jgi:hypothetical protein
VYLGGSEEAQLLINNDGLKLGSFTCDRYRSLSGQDSWLNSMVFSKVGLIRLNDS